MSATTNQSEIHLRGKVRVVRPLCFAACILVITAILSPGPLSVAYACSAHHPLESRSATVFTTNIAQGEERVRPDTPITFNLSLSHPGARALGLLLSKGHYLIRVERMKGDVSTELVTPSRAEYDGRAHKLTFKPEGGWEPLTGYRVSLMLTPKPLLPGHPKGLEASPPHAKTNPSAMSKDGVPLCSVSFRTGPPMYVPQELRIVDPPLSIPCGEKRVIEVRVLDAYELPVQGTRIEVLTEEYGSRLHGSITVNPCGATAFEIANTEAEAALLVFKCATPEGDLRAEARLQFTPGEAALITASAHPAMAEVGEAINLSGEVQDAYGNPCGGEPIVVGLRRDSDASTGSPSALYSLSTDDSGRFELPIHGSAAEGHTIHVRTASPNGSQCTGASLRVIWFCAGANREGTREYSLGAGLSTAGPVRVVLPRSVVGSAGSSTPGCRVTVSSDAELLGSAVSAEDGSFAVETNRDIEEGEIIVIREEPKAERQQPTYSIEGRFGWGSPDPYVLEFTLESSATVRVSYHTLETQQPDYHEERLYFYLYPPSGTPIKYSGGGDYTLTLAAGTYRIHAKSALGVSRARLTVTVMSPD